MTGVATLRSRLPAVSVAGMAAQRVCGGHGSAGTGA